MRQIALCSRNLNDRIALRGVRYHARLGAMSQRTTVEQTFVNQEERAIEAVYTFPLPENAAVCVFEVITGDRILTGTIEENDAAIKKYDEAVDDGHGGFLLEQDRPDVFSVRVGNLKPRQAATIRLTYVGELEVVDGVMRVAFPTTMAPRYVTATGTDPMDAAIDGDVLNPPHVLCVPYGLTMEVEIDREVPVKEINSPSHPIRVEKNEEGVSRVALARTWTVMDRDLVLEVQLNREQRPGVQVDAGDGGESYIAVTFLPELEQREAGPSEVVFVLDCSGSMQGDSIEQASQALEVCLRSLSAGDLFNVCRFGSRYELFRSEPVGYGEQSLREALRFIDGHSDFGGTELLPPLEAILKVPVSAGTVRNIVLLTDGQISNTNTVLELARRQRGTNRIFSFGIGHACSAHLVRGLARASGGAAEFITAGERIEEKVLRTFSRMASPAVTDVQIDWGNADVQTLSEFPPVFDGDALTVFGRVAGKAPEKVLLRYETAAGPRAWTVDVPAARRASEPLIATLWARRVIRSLEEVNALDASAYRRKEKTREAAELIRISKQFNLLSTLTTFVAIEHRSVEERAKGRPALRKVPVLLATGWGGIDARVAGPSVARCMVASAPAMLSRFAVRRRNDIASSGGRVERGSMPEIFDQLSSGAEDAYRLTETSLNKTGDDVSDLVAVLSSQSAQGFFEKTSLVSRLLGVASLESDEARRLIEAAMGIGNHAEKEQLIHTVLVLLLIRTRFSSHRRIWLRPHDKARRYLGHELGKSASEIEAMLETLEKEVVKVK